MHYYLKSILNHPKIVATFENFDGDNPFDPIKLCGAITHPSDYCVEKYGILSTVIEYHTLYQYDDDKKFTLALALETTMSVNSILGLPAIVEG